MKGFGESGGVCEEGGGMVITNGGFFEPQRRILPHKDTKSEEKIRLVFRRKILCPHTLVVHSFSFEEYYNTE